MATIEVKSYKEKRIRNMNKTKIQRRWNLRCLISTEECWITVSRARLTPTPPGGFDSCMKE